MNNNSILKYNFFFIAIAILMFHGCSSILNNKLIEQKLNTSEKIFSNQNNKNSNIIKEDSNLSLFEEYRPKNVGDILTIILQENISASNDSSENIIRNGNSQIKISPFNNPLNIMNNLQKSKHEFNSIAKNDYVGKGNSSAKNFLQGMITVTVNKIYPNGNLEVYGEKTITINQGTEFIQFSGIVNPRNIDNNNSVISTQVSNANVKYISNNYINNVNGMGWLQRLFFRIWPL